MLWHAHYIESRLVCYTCFFMEPMKRNCLMLHPLETGRMAVHKASPLLHWSACGWLVRRMVVKCTMLFQGCMTAIGAKLMVRHLFFVCFFPQQTSVSDEWLRMALTFHYFSLTLLFVLQCKLTLFHSPKLVLLQSFEDNLNVSSCFVSFPQVTMYTRTCNTIQKDR